MFVPLRDENTLRSIQFQFVTIALIIVNVAVFLLEQSGMQDAAIASFALIPGELFNLPPAGAEIEGLSNQQGIPEPLTLITYMFFHASWLHLIGNMLFLWVFGDNVEDAMGHTRFLVFYLLCGVFAGLLHAYIASTSTEVIGPDIATAVAAEKIPIYSAPLIGASGAVAGVIAAYLMLHPRVRVWVLAFRVIPLRIYAYVALGFWVLMQLVMVMLPQAGPVAWWAHVGGLLAGAILVIFLRKPGVPLFDKGLSKA